MSWLLNCYESDSCESLVSNSFFLMLPSQSYSYSEMLMLFFQFCLLCFWRHLLLWRKAPNCLNMVVKGSQNFTHSDYPMWVYLWQLHKITACEFVHPCVALGTWTYLKTFMYSCHLPLCASNERIILKLSLSPT